MPISDKKHWSAKSDLKHDEFKDAVELALDWILANRAQAAGILAGAVALTAVVSVALYARRARRDAAWNDLISAEAAAGAGKYADAQTLIARAQAGGGGGPAQTMAHMLDGDLRYASGQYDQALSAYQKAAEAAPENLRGYALADQVQTLAVSGKPDRCVAAAQSFLDARPQDLLAPLVSATMARCQSDEGQAAAAQATYEKIALMYPRTPWADMANARLAPAKAR